VSERAGVAAQVVDSSDEDRAIDQDVRVGLAKRDRSLRQRVSDRPTINLRSREPHAARDDGATRSRFDPLLPRVSPNRRLS
jgi:hypothetical protein